MPKDPCYLGTPALAMARPTGSQPIVNPVIVASKIIRPFATP